MRSLGVDVAFNYKKVSTREVLQKEGPINLCVFHFRHRLRYTLNVDHFSYWDNVGGESLEAALEFAAQKAVFIVRRSLCIAPAGS